MVYCILEKVTEADEDHIQTNSCFAVSLLGEQNSAALFCHKLWNIPVESHPLSLRAIPEF
jgi:hypothetical protein